MREFVEARVDVWYVLSAECGLLHADDVVEPYERTLNMMQKPERTRWGERVRAQLHRALPTDAEVLLLVGKRYREQVEPSLRRRGNLVVVPLEGLGIGQQLRWLKDATRERPSR
jgi:hypothetical protein